MLELSFLEFAVSDPRLAEIALALKTRLSLEVSLGVDAVSVTTLAEEALFPEGVSFTPANVEAAPAPSAPIASPVATPIATPLPVTPTAIASPKPVITPPTTPQPVSAPAYSGAASLGALDGVPQGDTGSEDRVNALAPVRKEAEACEKCGLSKGRTQVVFGEGSVDAKILFVGEAPGRDEDRQGRPFVGRAGRLLTKMIEGAFGRPRAEVYICNVLKCRPPGNRDPQPDEVASCIPYLKKQVEIIRPKVIVCLGHVAGAMLTGDENAAMETLQEPWFEFEGIPLKVIYHPAHLLRERGLSGGNKTEADRQTWVGIQDVLRLLGDQ